MSESESQLSQPSPQRNHRVMGVLTLVLLVLLVWQWADGRQRYSALESNLARHLSELEAISQESRILAKKAEESTAQNAARIAVLEQKLTDSQSQQEALQTLYMEFANNHDERAISEVEQLLIIASEQLQLAGNLRAALIALQTADMRLEQLNKPQAIHLRKLISNDIARLQALPSVDTVGFSLRLEGISAMVQKLPLMSDHHPKLTDDKLSPDFDSNPWRRLLGEIWQDVRKLVRIERIDRPEPPLLAPEQAYFLRENLRLRLLTARVALLQRDESNYHADLRASEEWLKRHFDTSDKTVLSTMSVLHQMAGNSITIQLPDISETLNAAGQYKVSLVKEVR